MKWRSVVSSQSGVENCHASKAIIVCRLSSRPERSEVRDLQQIIWINSQHRITNNNYRLNNSSHYIVFMRLGNLAAIEVARDQLFMYPKVVDINLAVNLWGVKLRARLP